MPTVILYVPSITAEEAKQSAWMVPALSSGAGFLTLWLVDKLGKRFPGQDLLQFSTLILGKFLGKILGGGYILFFLVFNFLIIRQFSEVLRISFLEKTPYWFIALSLVFVSSYGVKLGFEVIARSAQFVLPLFIGSLIIIVLLAFQDIEYYHLFPFFEGGLSPILKASVTPAAWFGEVIIVAFLLPNLNKPQEMFRKSSYALVAGIAVLSGDILLTLLILGPELSGSYNLPFWKVIRYLEIGQTFLRVETILIFLWVATLIIKFTLIYYLGSITLAQVFGLKSYRSVVLPLGLVLVGCASIFADSNIELAYLLKVFWPPFAFFFELMVPGLLLVTAWALKKQGRKKA